MKFSFFTLTESGRISFHSIANGIHQENASMRLLLDSLLTGRRDQCQKGAQQRKPSHPRGRRGIVVPHVRTKLFGSDCVQPKCCSSRSHQTHEAGHLATLTMAPPQHSKGREIRLILSSLNFKVDVLAIARVSSGFCTVQAGSPAPPKAVTPQVRNNTFYLVVKPSCCSYSPHPPITYTSKCLPTSRRK